MRLLLLNYISSGVTECLWKTFIFVLSLVFIVPFQLYALVCFCWCYKVYFFFFFLKRFSIVQAHTDLIRTSPGIIREGGSLTCKGGSVVGGGSVVVVVGGDSHSVDPHSVSRLKGRAEKEGSE